MENKTEPKFTFKPLEKFFSFFNVSTITSADYKSGVLINRDVVLDQNLTLREGKHFIIHRKTMVIYNIMKAPKSLSKVDRTLFLVK